MATRITNQYYFLASPYHGSSQEMAYRQRLSHQVVTYFLDNYISVFAPIIYNQAIVETLDDIKLEERRKLLMPMNLDFLYRSAGVLLLKIEGWDTSWSVQHYIEICHKSGIPLYDLDPEQLEKTLLMLEAPAYSKNSACEF